MDRRTFLRAGALIAGNTGLANLARAEPARLSRFIQGLEIDDFHIPVYASRLQIRKSLPVRRRSRRTIMRLLTTTPRRLRAEPDIAALRRNPPMASNSARRAGGCPTALLGDVRKATSRSSLLRCPGPCRATGAKFAADGKVTVFWQTSGL